MQKKKTPKKQTGKKPQSPYWKRKINKCCKDAGTYRPELEVVIDQLADVMRRRDKAVKKFKDEGEQFIVEYENTKGAVNATKNPLVQQINDLDALALNFWRELGITPRALKSLGEDAVKKNGKKSLGEMLAEIEEQ